MSSKILSRRIIPWLDQRQRRACVARAAELPMLLAGETDIKSMFKLPPPGNQIFSHFR